ncbi:MAG: hypothetical protein HC897_13345, partial [Thermoanaerobaculia bacterium]|nr:hypothetical protein [Thermoanaerobaculia bacterium]
MAAVFGLLAPALLAAPMPPSLRFTRLGVDDGLSHTTVWDVEQDARGFIWIATETSVQRYDGYELVDYQHDPDDPRSISDSDIIRIFRDRHGRLWLAGRDQALNRYDPESDGFVRYPPREGAAADQHNAAVYDVADDHDGGIWLATPNGLDRLDPATGAILHLTHDAADPASLATNVVDAVLEDAEGKLWIGTDAGLDRRDPVTGQIEHFLLEAEPADARTKIVLALAATPDGTVWVATAASTLYRYDRRENRFVRVATVPDNVISLLATPEGQLWMASYGGGLSRFDPATGQLASWLNDPADPESLSSNEALRLMLDDAGLLWVATRDGLSLYDPRRSRFTVLRAGEPGRGLSGRNVSAIFEDQRGELRIGSLEGSVDSWNPVTGKVEPWVFDPFPGSVKTIFESRSGQVWAGCERGLFRFDEARRRLLNVVGSDAFGLVTALAEDSAGTLWLGGSALATWTPKDGLSAPIPTDPSDPAALAPKRIYSLLVDRAGQLWVGGEGGLSRLDPLSRAIRSWRHDPQDPGGLPRADVTELYEDRAGQLWIGTYGSGLLLFDAATERFRDFRERDGLADDHVTGLLEDAGGKLWVSTNKGLSRFDPESGAFRSYDAADGLASKVFLIRSRFETRDHRLVFGGQNGLTLFDPAQLADDPVLPRVVITELRVGGEVMRPGAEGSPLSQAIAETRELSLRHGRRSFSFTFAGLHFANPSKNRYAYRLDGYDPDWLTARADDRRARYTNLDPGEYVFRVKAANADGVWSPREATLRIHVLPPPWKSWWAFTLYGLGLVGTIVGYDRWQERRLEREREISRQLRETDRLKNEFLANTSHELRTPLFGITGLAESLLDGVHGELPVPVCEDLAMMVASGRRLGGLVDDILDFSRLRRRELGLAFRAVDLSEAVELVFSLTMPLVGNKRLELVNAVEPELPDVHADENRLQQILLNLVSNAIKFTERGRVEISARVEGERVRVAVSDTGIGIAADQRERIFAPFEQVDASAERIAGGTGLGLAITRHLVELHGSTIELDSTLGVGSHFVFSLPIAKTDPAAAGSPAEAQRRMRTSVSSRVG